MKRRHLLAGAAATGTLAAFGPLSSWAQAPATRMVVGYTAVTDFASAFVAAEEGYFKRRNLDVELKFIPLNSTIPAAVQAGSLQIGGPTPSVFLQAVDGGLDHVVVAGGGVTAKTLTGFGLVARAGSGIRTAQDCVGRKIGVPGLGAFLHVTFRGWLKSQGVDDRKVNFVEAAFPQHGDLLRGGTLDAVVSADPFMSRITESGQGYVASYYATFLPEGQPTIVYSAAREWATQNAAAVRAFQQAIQEGAAFVARPANDARVRQAIGKYIKLPPAVLAKVQVSPPGASVTTAQMSYWVGLMKDQEMFKGAVPDVSRLLFK